MLKNADNIMRLTHGKWPGILMHFGVEERFLSGKNCPCPMCGGKDRFRFINKEGDGWWVCNQCGSGDGMDLLMATLGVDFKTARDKVKPMCSGVVSQAPPRVKNREKLMKGNSDLWQRGKKDHELLYEYMRSRGLKQEEVSGADLRLVPNLELYNDEGGVEGRHPAMVARISTRDGKMALIHRTYLFKQEDGTFKTEKKMTPSAREWKGGAIRLTNSKDDIRLIIAEGIETALSVRARIHRKDGVWIPCWATGSAQAMENVAIPEHIKTVMVAGDNDLSFTGQKAAFILANRLVVHDKRKTMVVLPQVAGTDFNDELMRLTDGSI